MCCNAAARASGARSTHRRIGVPKPLFPQAPPPLRPSPPLGDRGPRAPEALLGARRRGGSKPPCSRRLVLREASQMHEGAGRSSSAARGRGRGTRMTVFTETERRGTHRRTTDRSGCTSALGAHYGLEQSHANAPCCAGASGGGSTARFTCRRIFWMTLLSLIAAMIRRRLC
jgi:hypothetical protein